MKNESKGLNGFLQQKPWLLVMFLAGVILLLLPGRGSLREETESVFTPEEERLSRVLESTDGVGETLVLLSVGSGRNDSFTGAVVVCRGAADPEVRLRIVESVKAFTGLGSNYIVVQKMSS